MELDEALYTAVPTSKPAWADLGDTTRSVWRQKADTGYDGWIVYRHVMSCLLCRSLVADGACGMCHDKWEMLE